MQPFKLHADYEPAGDQPQAIEKLVQGLASRKNLYHCQRHRTGAKTDLGARS